MFQDEQSAQISDLALTRDAATASLTIGEGDILVVNLKTRQHSRIKASDIRLLSCFIVNQTESAFDVLAANGRAEIVRVSVATEGL